MLRMKKVVLALVAVATAMTAVPSFADVKVKTSTASKYAAASPAGARYDIDVMKTRSGQGAVGSTFAGMGMWDATVHTPQGSITILGVGTSCLFGLTFDKNIIDSAEDLTTLHVNPDAPLVDAYKNAAWGKSGKVYQISYDDWMNSCG